MWLDCVAAVSLCNNKSKSASVCVLTRCDISTVLFEGKTKTAFKSLGYQPVRLVFFPRLFRLLSWPVMIGRRLCDVTTWCCSPVRWWGDGNLPSLSSPDIGCSSCDGLLSFILIEEIIKMLHNVGLQKLVSSLRHWLVVVDSSKTAGK